MYFTNQTFAFYYFFFIRLDVTTSSEVILLLKVKTFKIYRIQFQNQLSDYFSREESSDKQLFFENHNKICLSRALSPSLRAKF